MKGEPLKVHVPEGFFSTICATVVGRAYCARVLTTHSRPKRIPSGGVHSSACAVKPLLLEVKPRCSPGDQKAFPPSLIGANLLPVAVWSFKKKINLSAPDPPPRVTFKTGCRWSAGSLGVSSGSGEA